MKGNRGKIREGTLGPGPGKAHLPSPALSFYTNKRKEGRRGSFIYRNDNRELGEPPPQKQGSSLLLSSLKKKEEKKRRRRKNWKDRKRNRRRLHSSFSALAKMDPRFIFNHARPRPICLVYSAEERTGLGGDHYLDTQLTNEARLGRHRLCCCRCWKIAWIFFLCPPFLTPSESTL